MKLRTGKTLLAVFAVCANTIFAQTGNNPFGYAVAPDTTSADPHPVGSTKGSLTVSDLGGAVYSVAIEAPKGLPEATPQISLSYNGSSGTVLGIIGDGSF